MHASWSVRQRLDGIVALITKIHNPNLSRWLCCTFILFSIIEKVDGRTWDGYDFICDEQIHGASLWRKTEHRSQTPNCPNIQKSMPPEHFPEFACITRKDQSFDQELYFRYGESTFDAKHFLSVLRKRGAGIAFVGDSLTQQMYHTLMCTIEGQLGNANTAKDHFYLSWAPFLVNFESPYRLNPQFAHHKVSGSNLSERWIDEVLQLKVEKLFLIINTGPWFDWGRILSDTTAVGQNVLVKSFHHHFREDGKLVKTLTKLIRANITVIWRDTAPAGVCDVKNQRYVPASSQRRGELYPVYNRIARQAVLDVGGKVLPNIWNSSLPRWRQHVEMDTMHWCSLRSNSVPWMWNYEAIKLIYSYLHSAITEE